MTNPAPMPDPSSAMHLAAVDYACTFAALTAGPVTFAVPDPVHFTFSFETGSTEISPGVVQVSTDYSWFTQSAVEADIAGAMEAISDAIAELTGLPAADVRAASQVQRVWTYRPNVQGGGWSSGAIVNTDVFYWTPLPAGAELSGSGAATATDGVQ